MRFFIKLTFLLIPFLSFCDPGLDSLRNLLFKEISSKHLYDIEKLDRIDKIKSGFGAPSGNEEIFWANKVLINEYLKYSSDSCIKYIERNLGLAKQINNPTYYNNSLIDLVSVLRTVGRGKEAEDYIAKVDTSYLGLYGMILFRDVQRKLAEDLIFYSTTSESYDLYQSQYEYYRNELVRLISEESDVFLGILEKDLLDQRKLDSCLSINSIRFNRASIGGPNYSLVSFQRSLIYELKDDPEKRKKYLILSAISDIRASIKDNASLATLASIWYNEGKVADAYFCIQSAYEDAIRFNSPLRFQEISKVLLPIATSFQELNDEQRDRLRINLIIISLLTIVLLVTIFLIYRQVKKLSVARNGLKKSNQSLNETNLKLVEANMKLEKLYDDLSESDLVKEHYIASFLDIHSQFIDKIDTYQKLVIRMLVGRKFDQLLDQIKSGQFVQNEINYFYEIFDKAFLDIFPDFITGLNGLLRPEERILLKEDELLNTELRVFALIRLGITDSSVIARLLRYSVNTIYNYRVKIKNKAAVPREEFEGLVQRIDSFEKR